MFSLSKRSPPKASGPVRRTNARKLDRHLARLLLRGGFWCRCCFDELYLGVSDHYYFGVVRIRITEFLVSFLFHPKGPTYCSGGYFPGS